MVGDLFDPRNMAELRADRILRDMIDKIMIKLESQFQDVVQGLNEQGIDVWGWYVPRAATVDAGKEKAQLVASLAEQFNVTGVLKDAESGGGFFKGNTETANTYARTLRETLIGKGKGLAICSHDIPKNLPEFPFDKFAQHATVNASQVSSVLRRQSKR